VLGRSGNVPGGSKWISARLSIGQSSIKSHHTHKKKKYIGKGNTAAPKKRRDRQSNTLQLPTHRKGSGAPARKRKSHKKEKTIKQNR